MMNPNSSYQKNLELINQEADGNSIAWLLDQERERQEIDENRD